MASNRSVQSTNTVSSASAAPSFQEWLSRLSFPTYQPLALPPELSAGLLMQAASLKEVEQLSQVAQGRPQTEEVRQAHHRVEQRLLQVDTLIKVLVRAFLDRELLQQFGSEEQSDNYGGLGRQASSGWSIPGRAGSGGVLADSTNSPHRGALAELGSSASSATSSVLGKREGLHVAGRSTKESASKAKKMDPKGVFPVTEGMFGVRGSNGSAERASAVNRLRRTPVLPAKFR
jgi:hypothetical protein